VEAWDIKAQLIRVFGFGGFSSEVLDSQIIQIREVPNVPGHVTRNGEPKTPQVIAKATVRLTVFGIGPDGQDAVYTESAVGNNSGWDIGETADNSVKSAASGALKRCAINLGTQFGLSLYQNGSHQDVVRVMFHERQDEMLRQAYSAPPQPQAQRPANPEVQQLLQQATSEQVAADADYAPPVGGGDYQ
jgi:recombination DNA repair RAD52 pathway protein